MRLKIHNILVFVAFTTVLMVGCKSQKGKFAFLSPTSGEIIVLGEKVAVRMQFPDNTLDSVIYSIDGRVVDKKKDTTQIWLDTEVIGLGTRNLVAKLYRSGKEEVAFSNVTILPESPKQYMFDVINAYTHDIKALTRELEHANGNVFETTCLGRGLESALRKVDLDSREILQKKERTG